jgi:hypothetical protein
MEYFKFERRAFKFQHFGSDQHLLWARSEPSNKRTCIGPGCFNIQPYIMR